MKTPQEWIGEFSGKPTYCQDATNGVYLMPNEIEDIQKDAFESGRVAGLRESMVRVQWSAIPPETNDCCRKILCETYQLIEQLQPKDTCSKEGEM